MKKKLRLKTETKDIRSCYTIRLSLYEYNYILTQAQKFTDGNLSEFIRYAATHFQPNNEDFESAS